MLIQLSDHFTYKRLLRFTLSPILMMVFTSLYSIVDGLFVSNLVGKSAFAAVNLIMPFMMALGTFGYMVGAGGSAVLSRTLGEKKRELANRYFTMLVGVLIVLGILCTLFGHIFLRPVAIFLGAEGDLLENCVLYGRIIFSAGIAFMLQNGFSVFLVTAEKPDLSFKFSIAAGLTNAVLDFLFIAVFGFGLAGAALATALGQIVGGVLPLLYFFRPNRSLLRLTKTTFYGSILLETFTNGSSEMVANLTASLVGMLYNYQLMQFIGETGVAAFGTLMYTNFIFAAIFYGFGMGAGPLIGYNYGADNKEELKNLFKLSTRIILIAGALLALLAEITAYPLVKIFAGYDPEFFKVTLYGFRIFVLMFIFMGFNTFGSALFTGLSNGKISALVAFLRTMVCEVASLLILPPFFGLTGIWLSGIVAETLAMLLTLFFILHYKNRYGYL